MSDEKINPSLVKMAHALLEGHMEEVAAAAGNLQKEGFVPISAIKASQGMPPGMPPGAPMPPQPPMPPGAPGAPMPPAGPTPAAGPMPPGGGMPPGMPPDPSMMGGMPPDPSMMGGAPGGGQPIMVGLEDLMMLFQQIAQEQGAQGAEAEAMEGPNEGSEPATTNKQLGQRIDSLDEKLDMLLQAIGIPPEAGGEMGGMGGMGGEVPPDLEAAMGAVPPPDVAGGGMPPASMGAGMPPEMAAGTPTPMVGGPPPGGGMPVMASGNGGMKKAAAVSVSKLAARLRRR